MSNENKSLSDIERYNRDRASVMSMLKFILATAIIIAFCYAGKIVAVILVPFLIGFLLSKTSVIIAKPLSKLFDKDPSKIKPGKRKSTHTKVALIVYVILNIFVIFAIILTCIGLVYQANSLLVSIAEAARSFKPSEVINTGLLEQYSVENGGFLTPDMIESLKENVANMGQTIVKNIPQLISSSLSAVWKLVGNLPYGIFFVISINTRKYYENWQISFWLLCQLIIHCPSQQYSRHWEWRFRWLFKTIIFYHTRWYHNNTQEYI